MGGQPLFGSLDELVGGLRLGGKGQFGFALSVSHPCHGSSAVGVDGHLYSLLLLPRQGMYDSKKFADVIGSEKVAPMKDGAFGVGMYSSVLHGTGVATTSSVYRHALDDWFAGSVWRTLLCPLIVAVATLFVGFHGDTLVGKSLVLGMGKALNLPLALCPAVVHAGFSSIPHYVPFFCHRVLLRHACRGGI